MTIPTEPIGSIPRPLALIEAIKLSGSLDPALDPLFDEAIRDTIERFEATGSPVIAELLPSLFELQGGTFMLHWLARRIVSAS